MAANSLLSVNEITAGYGDVQVLHDVSFSVAAGEVVGLLGRNGAGKSTTLKAIMGLVSLSSGRIALADSLLNELAPHLIPGRGVAYVPQGRRLFPGLSVQENLDMGLLVRDGGADTLAWVLELFPMLKDRLDQAAGTLSGGQQQMVAMARALCAKPRVLLLDEPSEGLMPSLIDKVMETVAGLRDRQVGVLLVEQKVEAALRVADRVIFMENGRIVQTSTPAELDRDPEPLIRHVGVKR